MFLKMSSFCAAEPVMSQLLVVVGCFQKSFSKLLQPFSHTHVPTLSILPSSLSLYLISLKSSLSLSQSHTFSVSIESNSFVQSRRNVEHRMIKRPDGNRAGVEARKPLFSSQCQPWQPKLFMGQNSHTGDGCYKFIGGHFGMRRTMAAIPGPFFFVFVN